MEYTKDKKRKRHTPVVGTMVPQFRKVSVESFAERVLVVADDPITRQSVVVAAARSSDLSSSRVGMITLVKPRVPAWEAAFI
jgi:hypothetical protein